MERHFDKELAHLKSLLQRMGEIAEDMIGKAIDDLVNRTEEQFSFLKSSEKELDHLQIEVDDQVVTLLAIRQPMAVDLRFIVTASRICSDLERIGDQVVNIAENTHILLQEPPLKPLVDIPKMAAEAGRMVRDGIDSFLKQDVLLAQSVIANDDKVDDYKDLVLDEVETYMRAAADNIKRGLALILIARNFERIADHATNIGEEVIYVVQGRDVRHPGRKSGQPMDEKLH